MLLIRISADLAIDPKGKLHFTAVNLYLDRLWQTGSDILRRMAPTAEMEVGEDGVAVITLVNPPVNALHPQRELFAILVRQC